MKKPEVSVVIVNYNGKHLLKDALDSVENIKFKETFETIVVDNNSSDGSSDFIKKKRQYSVDAEQLEAYFMPFALRLQRE